ncbi:MAG: hypothetical protein ACI9C3_001652, partial [Yoonia sp.]
HKFSAHGAENDHLLKRKQPDGVCSGSVLNPTVTPRFQA